MAVDVPLLKLYLGTHAQNAADLLYGFWAALKGSHYLLGAEAYKNYGPEPVAIDPDAGDCSGDTWGCTRMADEMARVKGFARMLWHDGRPFQRTTAHGYYLAARQVEPPYEAGDVVIYKRPSRYYRSGKLRRAYNAHHIAQLTHRVNGEWHVFEARKGVEEHTLSEHQGRRYYLGVFRFAWLPPLGEVTLPRVLLYRTLYYGYWGRDVGTVKKELKRLGYKQNPLSWTYWHNTERDVADFQSKHGLAETGNVDDATWRAILA